MRFTQLLACAASLTIVSAQIKGFNYGSVNTDGSPITESQYENSFKTAQGLVGASGFNNARLFTLIQAGTTNTPTQAIQAAINTKTSLLLGLWASAGQAGIDNELAAMRSALSTYGTAFTNLITGISVGSEDLYRISPIGIENLSGIGAGPSEVANYINEVRNALRGTGAAGKPVGHVDTWTAWVNGSNSAVIDASDFIGTDAYPYFQTTMANSIDDGYALFVSAYEQTVGVSKGKPVWVTETGWPVSGKVSNLAIASVPNAKTYWDQVGCGRLFGKVNTWWFTLQDAFPTTPNPSFGIVGTELSTKPIFDLSCSGSASSVPASATAAVSTKAAASQQAGGPGAQGEASAIGGGGASAQTGAPSGSPPSGEPAPAPSGKPAPAPSGGSEGGQTEYKTVTSCPEHCPEGSGSAPVPNTLITRTSILPAASPNACPVSLSGQYEFPHLIVPVDKNKPTTAAGTSYNGTISPTVSSIFNFDIPPSYSGKTCSLIFLFPTQDKLTTSAYSLSGSGGLDVARLTSPATEQTTYDTVPGVAKEFGGPSSISPGNEYVIGTGPCNIGRLGYKVSATGSLSLNYFQDYNPSPIGFYVTVC